MRAALAGLLAVIALFPVPQQISTTAVLTPLKKRIYYAPFDATVKNVAIRDEQIVAPGDLLLELESSTLRREFERLGRELVAHQTRLQQLNFEQHNQTPSSMRLAQITEEIEITKIKIEENQSLQARLQSEIDKLTITADTDGKLSTWDIAIA